MLYVFVALPCPPVRLGDTRTSHGCLAKVDSGCLATTAAKLSSISNLGNRVENRTLFRGGMTSSRMVSMRVGDGGSGGNGIMGRGDDKGDSGDSDGDGGIGATSHAFMRASVDGGKSG
ncbi:hypothetical protein Tco_1326075 [Tanacetum coccineum]